MGVGKEPVTSSSLSCSLRKGVSAQLFTKIYYSTGAVQGKGEGGRAAGGQEGPGSPQHVTPLRMCTRRHSWHQSTNKMQQSILCQSIFQTPRLGSRGDRGRFPKCRNCGEVCLNPRPVRGVVTGDPPLGGEGMEKDLGHLQVLCTPFPLILGSCPGVFLCPRERVWE